MRGTFSVSPFGFFMLVVIVLVALAGHLGWAIALAAIMAFWAKVTG